MMCLLFYCSEVVKTISPEELPKRENFLLYIEENKMTLKTDKWDVTEYLDNEEDIAEYLNAVIELDDPALLQAAIGDVAKAQGMTKIAKDAGLGRESLYKSLSAQGNPSFTTILKVLHALGTRISIQPEHAI